MVSVVWEWNVLEERERSRGRERMGMEDNGGSREQRSGLRVSLGLGGMSGRRRKKKNE